MWMQHHNGMFRSTDAGANWTQLTPPGDDFGFAVAAHPKDPLTAWFVPAIKDELRMPRDGALCVTRTRDGGKSWETLREGLPQRDAYDLDLPPRPRCRRDRRRGWPWARPPARCGSATTPATRWQLVNAHLPPIYGCGSRRQTAERSATCSARR